MITTATEGGGVGLKAQEVGALYGALAARVRSAVCAQVRAAEADVDDACQVAWGRLFVHRADVHRETALGWLIVTARHETLRLIRAARHTVPLEGLGEGEEDVGETARRRPGAIRSRERPAPSVEALVAARLALRSIDRLSERQRRLVWLQGLGLSYEEMARATGSSVRTVERQLRRAKQSLREDI